MNFLCIFNIVIVLSLIPHQDTAGSERFESISTLYYRGAKAAIVCYGKIMFGQSQLRVLNCTDCGLGLNFRGATGLFINGVKFSANREDMLLFRQPIDVRYLARVVIGSMRFVLIGQTLVQVAGPVTLL